MRSDEYGLGVDIGYRNVVAAVCRRLDDGGGCTRTLRPDGGGRFPTDVRMGTDGRLSLGSPDDPATEGCSAAQAMSRIGVPTPLYVAGRPVPAPDVVAAVVARMREVAEAQEGAPPAWTVLTVPPSWGAHRRGVLTDALAAASDTPVSLISAAVAVTRSHLATSPLPEHATVVVFDLGASTLDTATVRSVPGGSIEHLAVPPALPWGGRDVDDVVLGHVTRCLDLPARGRTPAPDLAGLRSQCVAAKEALSTDMSVDLTVALPTATRSVRLTREDLDELVADSVAASVDAVRSAVDDAGLTLDDVDGVLLAGGGARIPMVAEMLSAELGRPLFAASDPALSAAHGAAALALDLGTAGSVGRDGRDSIPGPDVHDTVTSEDADEDGGHALARRRLSRAGAGVAPAGPPRGQAGPPRSRATVRTAHRLARGGIVAALFAALLLLPVAVSGLLDSRLVDLTVDRSAADAGEVAPPPPVVPPPGPEQDTAPAAGLSPASAGQAAGEGGDAAAAREGGSADDEGTAARSRTAATPTTGALPTPEAPVAPQAGGATVPRAPVPPTTVPPTTAPPTTDAPTAGPPTPPTTEASPGPTTSPPVDPPTQAPASPSVEPAPGGEAEPDPADSGNGAGATGPAGGVA